jgi:hypothetical protein
MLDYQVNKIKNNFLFDTQFTNSLYSGPLKVDER